MRRLNAMRASQVLKAADIRSFGIAKITRVLPGFKIIFGLSKPSKFV